MTAPRTDSVLQRRLIFICVAVVSIALVLASYFVAASIARENNRQAGDRQLQIIALDIESVLERYETLPFAISYLPLTAEALLHKNDASQIQALNLSLQELAEQAKVAAIYLMDVQGNTIAASNWNTAQTYLGQNFAFRPYFSEALKQLRPGHFYAIGNTTNIPGYFISQPVYPPGSKRGTQAPIGVIAVKIILNEFEQAWGSSEEPIALSDRHGVVFLSNRGSWKYHSLQSLSPAVQQDLKTTLQYGGKNIEAISELPLAEKKGFDEYLQRPIGRLNWQLMLFPDQGKVTRAGLQSALVVALILGIALAFAAVLDQRRRRLEEGRLAQHALKKAADELELHIAERTQQLTQANAELENRYLTLKHTETLLRSTQNEMVQAGKLAMLGQMATGITHELNQPLTAIRAFADNAITFMNRGKAEQALANLEHISHASERMGSIIAQLKGFARKSPNAIAEVDVQMAIQSAVSLLRSETDRRGVNLHVRVAEPVKVLGDTVRIEQVLINLIRNALDAVENSPVKEVEVQLSNVEGMAKISITDTGTGIPEHVAGHLFEPFFTTKEIGHGLGLGLAISSSIVQAMNGSLVANNRPDGGAEFTVCIPLAADPSNQD
ncbi:sensor histidine kinase [Undibacterium pigrum]|uniref:C4-dicarboxylate transport sensor protein DctB n=1 Tax=Undibacterium pigrum TaxID=401470 RepID=A0A318JU00_9BURK|nr:ATP-binding protein [Undibacterium pigrum]PXX43958.1 two-component system C4-dicarboxylate transport sensor histidine kinase DctB [Undibacterium pigrum]